jgi:hypothetical protein
MVSDTKQTTSSSGQPSEKQFLPKMEEKPLSVESAEAGCLWTLLYGQYKAFPRVLLTVWDFLHKQRRQSFTPQKLHTLSPPTITPTSLAAVDMSRGK